MTNYINSTKDPSSKGSLTTHYVSDEQLDIISRLSDEAYPLLALAMNAFGYGSDYEDSFDPSVLFTDEFIDNDTSALTRYLAGDETVVFKIKEDMYRLWGIDEQEGKVYFDNYSLLAPATDDKYKAFIAPIDEITKWKTPDWNIERAD